MKLMQRQTCPLCRSADINQFRKGNIAAASLSADDFKITDSRYGSRWTFFACRRCGFVFANPGPSPGDLARFYSRLQDREYSQEKENRAKNFGSILENLRRLAPPGREILDVGAASGIFLDLARRQGFTVDGIEPSRSLANEAKRLYGLTLFVGTLEAFRPRRKFAMIALMDILEHLVDAEKFMKRISDLVAAGGILVVVTPDINSLAARLTGGRWWHYRIAHVQFFNARSLAFLLEKHGFEIILKKRYAWNFSAHYLLSRLFPRLKKDGSLQTALKKLNLRLQLFDSWEIYARKRKA